MIEDEVTTQAEEVTDQTETPAEPERPAQPAPFAKASQPPSLPQPRGGRPLTTEDIARIRVVGEPALSPDGQYAAVAVTTASLEKDEYRSAIWLVPTDPTSEEPRQLTSGLKRDTTPRWSPDGRHLLFTSNRDTDTPQLWVMPADGGEARRITKLENGVSDPVWAPDGRRVAFVSKVTPEEPNPGSDARVIRDIRYKFDGEGFLDGKWPHIFTVNVDDPDAKPEQVTHGDFSHRQPVWSPSGREIAFVANRNPDWQRERSADIWTVVPGAEPKRITDGAGRYTAPSYSPDGSQLAFLGTRNLDVEAANEELWVIPSGGGTARSLTASYDRSIADGTVGDTGAFPSQRPTWTPNGTAILVNLARDGEAHVHHITVPEQGEGEVAPLTAGARRVGAFSIDPSVADGSRFVIAVSDPVTPFELHLVAADQPERVLTAFNEPLLSEIAVSVPEPFWIDGEGGFRVQGWLMRPCGPAATKSGVKVPAILEIHGGPHSMYGLGFFHEFQVLAGRGYAVIFANPRGSTGYGEAFANDLHAAWGEKDFPDQMAVVDKAITLGNLDEDRLGVAGGSYGGFMTNWVIGHTDRFKAAVTERTISNMYSMYGTDDVSIISLDKEMGGPPWGSPELTQRYMELSPITYVQNMVTPLLILHAEQDYRCPIEQAEQLYLALKRLQHEVELVRFPNESHGLTRNGTPKHRAEHMRRLVEWFDTHL